MSEGAYNTTELAEYMRSTLAATAAVLGLTDLNAYQEAVKEVGLTLGSAEGPWAESGWLRALARREAWRLAMSQAAGDFSYSEDGASYNRQQVHAQAKQMYDIAADEVVALTPAAPSGGATARAGTTSRRVESVW